MAFPTVAGQANGAVTTNATSWTLTYPGSIAAGDLLIGIIGRDGGTPGNVGTWPSGWQADAGGDGDSGISEGNATLIVTKKLATGSESGTFSVTGLPSEQGIWQVLRITGWLGTLGTTIFLNDSSGGGVQGAGANTGSSTSPAAGTANPTNWDAEDTLWLHLSACDGTVTYTAKDANYTYVTNSPASSGGAGGAGLAVAWRQLNASSVSPSAYTLSGSEQWEAGVIAVRPAGAGTNHTRNVDDTLGLSDSASAVRGLKVNVNDTLGLADSMADQEGWRRLPADTLSLADSFSRALAFARAVNDTLALADSQTKVTGFRRAPADSFSLADSITPLIILSRAINDTLALADNLARSLGYRRLPADTLALADSLSRSLVYQRAPADSLALADSLARALTFSRSLADSLALADSIDVDFSGGSAEPAPDTGWPVGALTLADRGRALSADAVTLAGGASGRGAAKTASGQTDA